MLGGAVAGYLRRGELEDGATVGATAGLLAAVPLLIVLLLVFGGLSIGLLGMHSFGGAMVLGGLFWIGALFVLVVAVGLSAIGGLVGAYLAGRSDVGR